MRFTFVVTKQKTVMYVINQSGQYPIFQINEHIGFDADVKDEQGNIVEVGDGQGIDGKIFAREFFETDFLNPQLITVYTNTMGGDVQQSLDIANAIARVRTKTKGAIIGFAYSCGGWIPLVCDTVEMVEHGSWMCHMPYNPSKPDQKSDFLNAVLNTIAVLIASKSGRNGKPKKTVDEVKEMMQTKTYYTAKQMYDEGLIDYITDASGKRIKTPAEETIAYNIDTDYKEIKLAYKQKQVAFNKFFSEEKRKKLSETGVAMKDGSFPIESKKDLENAIKDSGRAKDPDAAKRHIKKRAKELGLESELPDSWKNSFNNNLNTIKMEKVVNRLNSVKAGGISFNLVKDSSEQEVIDGIARMENKINNLSTELDEANKVVNKNSADLKAANESKAEMEGRMKELQSAKNEIDSEVENLKNKMENMEAENKKLKEKADDAEKKEKETAHNAAKEKATKLIEANILNGKIRAANKEEMARVKTGWIEDAVENFDKTERILNSMAASVALPFPNFEQTGDEKRPDDGDGSIKHMMAQNKAERDRRQNNWQERQDKIFNITNTVTGTN